MFPGVSVAGAAQQHVSFQKLMNLLFRANASNMERVATMVLISLFVLCGYGLFVSFLPSERYIPIALFVTALLGLLAVLPFVLWWGLNSRIQGAFAKAVGYVFMFILFSFFAFFAAMFSGPHLVTVVFGEPHEEEAVVTGKDRSRRGCSRELEIQGHNSKLCVSPDDWNHINVGERVTLRGQQSLLGFSVTSVKARQHQS